MNVVNINDAPKSKQEKLDDFCRLLADGKSKRDAYVGAGYAEHYAEANAQKYYRQNAEYIKGYMDEHIGSHVPTALKVVLQILNNPNEKGGIRLKAAQDILDRAGHNAKTKVEITTKDTKDMTTEELNNELQRLLSENPQLGAILTGIKPVEE